jgi:hypothetical protein
MKTHGGRNYCGFCVTAAALALTACTPVAPAPPIGRPHSLATMTVPIGADVDLESLRAQIEALPFSGAGHTRGRKAQGQPIGISVKIRPVGDSYLIDSASGPLTPTIVAWIENQNFAYTTENPVFKPKNQAQYLVQVYREAPNPEAKYQIIEVPSGLRGTVSVIKSGVLIPCYHPPQPHPDADFRSCDGWHEVAASLNRMPSGYAQMSMRGSFFREASYVQPNFTGKDAFVFDPTWIACNAGCCTLAGTN